MQFLWGKKKGLNCIALRVGCHQGKNFLCGGLSFLDRWVSLRASLLLLYVSLVSAVSTFLSDHWLPPGFGGYQGPFNPNSYNKQPLLEIPDSYLQKRWVFGAACPVKTTYQAISEVVGLAGTWSGYPGIKSYPISTDQRKY